MVEMNEGGRGKARDAPPPWILILTLTSLKREQRLREQPMRPSVREPTPDTINDTLLLMILLHAET